MSREARLLLVTIVVSIALLFLLARYRFPSATRSSVPVAPLDRLAARATFDELASIIAGLEPMMNRAIVVLRVMPPAPVHRALDAVTGDLPRFAPALRIRDDIAIAAVEPGARVVGLVGDDAATAAVVGQDFVRGLAAVRVPAAPAPTVSILSSPLTGVSLRYVAAVEGTTGGPAVRPLFLGRTDPVADTRWQSPLLAIGGSPTSEAGSFVFTLDGRLAGLVVREEGLPALVSAPVLLEAVDPLVRGESIPAAELGVQVQPLTRDLAIATGAPHGAVVSSVARGGPSDDRVRAGDVIVAIGGRSVYTTEGFRHTEAALRAGTGVAVYVVRIGTQMALQLTPRQAPAAATASEGALGLIMRAAAGRGSEIVRVLSDSASEATGLRPGDVITQVNEIPAPTPAQVRAAYDAAASGSALVVGVLRAGVAHVVALQKP